MGGHVNDDSVCVAVATGREGGDFTYAQRDGRDPAELKLLIDEARNATLDTPSSWTVAEESGFWIFKKPSLLRAYGDLGVSPIEMETDGGGIDDLSTDLLLKPSAWGEATEKLGSDLAVVVPKRGWLMVAVGTPGNIHATTKLFELGKGIASRGGRHAITGSTVIFMSGGLPSGVEVRSATEGYISLMKPDPQSWFSE